MFVKSHVGQHAELAWVLNCITNFDELQRMAQLKTRRLAGNQPRCGCS
jgi:tryptophanyl-tRNA synthetase